MNEFRLIEKFFAKLALDKEVAQDLKDDVAMLGNNGNLVVSKDMMVEDVHFLRSDGGFKVASRLLLSNLSDMAAAGAKPIHYLLGFTKTAATDSNFLTEFSRGLKKIQTQYGITLIGGDTVKGDNKLFFSVTIFGVTESKLTLARANAAADDLVFVSGYIGDAYLGRILANDKYLVNRYYFPTPRIELGKQLLQNKLSECAIDVSDGLLADLRQLCKANSSQLSAIINLAKIPISSKALAMLKRHPQIKLLDLVSAGDDYELIFTAKANKYEPIMRLGKSLKIPIAHIGYLKKSNKPGIVLLDENDDPIKIKKFGFEH